MDRLHFVDTMIFFLMQKIASVLQTLLIKLMVCGISHQSELSEVL